MLLPTAGRVTIDGIDLGKNPHEVRKRIGFLPDTPPLYNEMTVGDYLRFVAELRGVSGRDVRLRVAEVEEKTALTDEDGVLISSLSHGYRQRVGLAQALVHRPELLILDEPTSGLDPVQIVEMRQLIRSLRGQHTILLSSHILSEISQTVDRVLVINQGEIVAQGTEQELAGHMGGGGIEIEVVAPGLPAATRLRHFGEAQIMDETNGVARIHLQASPDKRPEVVFALCDAGVQVLRIDRAEAQLESIFLSLTKGKAS